MEHTRLGYWIEEAGEVEPRARRWTATARPTCWSSAAATRACGPPGTRKQLEPEARVVLLEAEPVCGHGPSGRNGGFCNAMWFSLASMRERWGDAPALATARAAEQAVARIGAFCEEQDVDAWFRPAGYLQVSTDAGPRRLLGAGGRAPAASSGCRRCCSR